jgi:hypothetical protein
VKESDIIINENTRHTINNAEAPSDKNNAVVSDATTVECELGIPPVSRPARMLNLFL